MRRLLIHLSSGWLDTPNHLHKKEMELENKGCFKRIGSPIAAKGSFFIESAMASQCFPVKNTKSGVVENELMRDRLIPVPPPNPNQHCYFCRKTDVPCSVWNLAQEPPKHILNGWLKSPNVELCFFTSINFAVCWLRILNYHCPCHTSTAIKSSYGTSMCSLGVSLVKVNIRYTNDLWGFAVMTVYQF